MDTPSNPPLSYAITLRDLYAGFALAGLLARQYTEDRYTNHSGVAHCYDETEAVQRAFVLADEMLVERERSSRG